MELILRIIFTFKPINGSGYGVINSSILQDFFSSVSECSSCNAEKKNYRTNKT